MVWLCVWPGAATLREHCPSANVNFLSPSSYRAARADRSMGFLGSFKALFAGKPDLDERFELMRSAISGTMSSFYMARDRTTGHIVGLKILDTAKTAAVESRFRNMNKPSEGEIATSIDHPNVVKTLEYGTASNGRQYIVMEFLDGPGLNSLIVARSELLDGNRVELLRQAATAIGAVHKAGFIHRDVCPRNFVATKDARSLKLIDFGLTVPNTPEFTQPGNRTGTPNYMAPEVVRRRRTSPSLDIFAYGVTAYELCTFELPWKRGTSGQFAMSHDTEPVDIFRYQPKLNKTLAATIMSCLAPKPEKRPATLDHVLHVLDKIKNEHES